MRQRNVKNKNEIINNAKNYVLSPTLYKGKWHQVFQNDNPINLEIGTGKGKFIIENAKRNPDINFIGLEKSDSILAILLKHIQEDIPNLRLIHLDAKDITEVFSNEITSLYLNFSDPWPKARHEKRRLTSPNFLEKYALIFKDSQNIIMKTDNKDLFAYSIKTLNNQGYYIKDITFDLESRKDPLNIKTEYEEKFTKLNNPIYKIEVIKREK